MSSVAVSWIALGVGAAMFVIAMRRLDKKHRRPLGLSHFDEWHHGYLGGLVAFGILFALSFPRRASWALFAFGLVLLIEDAIAHLIEAVRRRGWRGFFWHVYEWLLRRLKR